MSTGKISVEDGQTVLEVSTKDFRSKMASVIDLLQSDQVDVVYVTSHKKRVFVIKSFTETKKLSTGTVEL